MKYIKTYENYLEPKIGDYIVGKDDFNEYDEFISKNIGQIVDIEKNPDMFRDKIAYNQFIYTIKYENVPDELTDSFFSMTNDEEPLDHLTLLRGNIIFFSPNKEDVEDYIKANEFNI